MAKLLPPATEEADPAAGETVTVNIFQIRSVTFVGPVDSALERIASPADRRRELRVITGVTGPQEVELIADAPIGDEPPDPAA